MSEPNSSWGQSRYTLIFMVVLSLVCAVILSVLASALKEPQELAKELDRSREMLMAARIINPNGYFQIKNEQEEYVPAQYTPGGILKATEQQIVPNREQILEVYRRRIEPFLVNDKGEATTFKQAGLNEKNYLATYRKTGYYQEPFKLLYKVFANTEASSPPAIEGYVIPVNGMGLWDAIYGYLAVQPDGNTVIGISWYDQKETPGLGANISETSWQSQFPGKHLFQESANGQTHFKTAPLGLTVIKGKVNEILGHSPKALSAIDGMAGATLTGNGVTNAYRDVLASYRPFLLHLHETFSLHKKEAP